MSLSLAPKKGVSLTVIANDKLSAYSASPYKIYQLSQGSPNVPGVKSLLFSGSGAYNSAVLSTSVGTSVIIQGGERNLYYATGTGPVIPEVLGVEATQATPGTLNATGALTGALILGGIVTSTTAAAVVATLDTGTVMDAVVDSAALNDAFFWSAIATGANSFTVTAASGHTIVGSGVVATVTSGRFLTRRSAAATWVTYRLS